MTINLEELLNKAKEVAVAAGRVAGDVVGEVVDTSKAKIAEAKLTSEIREITERLGSIVYEAAKTGRESIKLQEMLIAELDNLYKVLGELRKKNVAASTAIEVICTSCGEKNAVSAVFCCKCGAKLIAEDTSDYAVDTEIADAVAEEPVEQPADEPTQEPQE